MAAERKGLVTERKVGTEREERFGHFREQIFGGNLPQPKIKGKTFKFYFPDTQRDPRNLW